MPPLPLALARQAQSVSAVPNVQVSTPALQQGLATVSGELARLSDKYEKQDEQDGRLWAAKRSIEIRTRLQQAMQDKLQSGEPVDGLGKWAATATDEAFRTALDEAPNKYAKNYMELAGVDTRGDLLLAGDKAESDFKVTQRVTQAEDTLNTFMGSAALGGAAEAERLAGQFKFTIEGMDGLPPETRAKMERGTRDILTAGVRGMIEKSPGAAADKAREYMSQGLIEAGDGQALIDAAQNEVDRQAARAEANAARADRLAAKTLAMQQDETAKTGYEMIAAGGVSADWVIQNRDNLSPSDYRIMLGALNDPTDQKTTVADMYRRIYLEGDDAREDIIGALESGNLSATTAKTLLDENVSNLDDSFALPPVKAARDYLKNKFDAYKSIMGPDGSYAAPAFADAQMNFENWLRNNPDATPIEIQTQAELEAQRAGILLSTQAISTADKPAYLKGDRNNPDLEATRLATVDAFYKRHNGDGTAVENDPQFQEEIRRIEELEKALEAKKLSGGAQ